MRLRRLAMVCMCLFGSVSVSCGGSGGGIALVDASGEACWPFAMFAGDCIVSVGFPAGETRIRNDGWRPVILNAIDVFTHREFTVAATGGEVAGATLSVGEEVRFETACAATQEDGCAAAVELSATEDGAAAGQEATFYLETDPDVAAR